MRLSNSTESSQPTRSAALSQALYTTHFDDPRDDHGTGLGGAAADGTLVGTGDPAVQGWTHRSVSASVTAIRDDSGQLIGAVAVNRDNSEMMLAPRKAQRRRRPTGRCARRGRSHDCGGRSNGGSSSPPTAEWLDTALSTGARMDMVSVGADYIRPLRECRASPAPEQQRRCCSGAGSGWFLTATQLTYRCDRPDGRTGTHGDSSTRLHSRRGDHPPGYDPKPRTRGHRAARAPRTTP